MKVTITNDDCSVEIEWDGGFSPDVLDEIAKRAVQMYHQAFADDETET